MFRFTTAAALIALLNWGLSVPLKAQEPALTLEEAVQIALGGNDPSLLRFAERAAAQDENAVADAQLPDPKLRIAAANFPIDSFRLDQEPMTQLQVGLSQAFPRGRTLSFSREKRQAEAKVERAEYALQELRIIRDTRLAWLDLFYWMSARTKVENSRAAVHELVDVVQSIFATGRGSSQEVLRAQLELSILDDRLVEMDRRAELARADLGRFIGSDNAARTLPPMLPVLTAPPSLNVLQEQLVRHPFVLMEDARVEAQERAIDVAKEQYKPGFSVDAGYGFRDGDDRADFVSVGVSLDVPLFTAKRQDRRVAAARHERQAARLDRQARLLDMEKALERNYADWKRLADRLDLYRKAVSVQASDTTQATLNAYQNGVADFPELIRSRLAELDVELTLLRLEVDQIKAQSQLLFLEGENE